MKERPILFNGAMVRAILSGAKSQTRRVVKVGGDLPPEWATFAAEGHSLTTPGGDRPSGLFYWSEEQTAGQALKALRRWPILPAKHPLAGESYWAECPFGKIGDRLWVRETWADLTATHGRHWEKYNAATGLYERGIHPFLWYAADGDQPEMGGGEINREPWRPSTSMPRSACRVVLEITEVRVERLHAISAADAEAEGLRKFPFEDSHAWAWRDGDRCGHASPTGAFRSLWTSTGGDWEANPWVWVIGFKRVEQ